jgi:hypothetical protein
MQISVRNSQKTEKPKAHYPVHRPYPRPDNLLHTLTFCVCDKRFNITIQLIVRYLTLSPTFRISEFNFLCTYTLPVYTTSFQLPTLNPKIFCFSCSDWRDVSFSEISRANMLATLLTPAVLKLWPYYEACSKSLKTRNSHPPAHKIVSVLLSQFFT